MASSGPGARSYPRHGMESGERISGAPSASQLMAQQEQGGCKMGREEHKSVGAWERAGGQNSFWWLFGMQGLGQIGPVKARRTVRVKCLLHAGALVFSRPLAFACSPVANETSGKS